MYTTVQLGITDSQLQTLLQGHKIFVEKHQFKGDVALPLTQKQTTTIATATRGVNLKFSTRQISAYQKMTKGEGIVKDIAAAAAPVVRKGVDAVLDWGQSKIPTHKLGDFKPLADGAVQVGRKLTGKLLDKLQALMGGDAGRTAIDAKMGAGWFDEYLLPGLETAAKIAVPLIRGSGVHNKPARYREEIDRVMGKGWFTDYLLPGLETAAKIAVPLIQGRGLSADSYSGEGWFTDYLLPGVETAAKIATPFLRGGKTGSGWEPMTQKKPSRGCGLVL